MLKLAQSSVCFLCHVHKQTVHNVLRCDPLLYLMALTGVSKSDFTDCTDCDFEQCWEFCFIVLRDVTV